MADEQLNEKDLNVEETGAGNAADTRVLELEEQLAAAKDQAPVSYTHLTLPTTPYV